MRKAFAILSLVVLFLAGFVPSKGASYTQEPPTDSLPLRVGVRLTTEGQKQTQIYNNLKGGDSLFRLSIAEDPTYAPAYYHLAQLLQKNREGIDSVIFYAKQAYEIDSLNKWYRESYAQALAYGGQFDKARRLFEEAIKSSPLDLNAYVMVAMLHSQTSNNEEAIAVLDSAEMRVGKNPYVSSFKRELLLTTNQTDRAIEESRSLIEIDPEDIENRIALAEIYASTEQDSLALQQFQEALLIEPASTEVLNSMGQYYLSKGNMPAYFHTVREIFKNPAESMADKISMFKRITSEISFYAHNLVYINPLAEEIYNLYTTDKEAVELYTQHLIASGNLDQALEIYKERTADTPAQYDYYTTIIDIESYLQRIDSVEVYVARAIEIFPDKDELKISQANVYSYTGRYKQAIKLYEDLAKVVPSDSLKGKILGYVGDNYHQLSLLEKAGSSKAKAQMRKAYKSYDRSLAIYPNNAMVLNNYAYFLSLDKQDLGKALDMAGRAIALEENNPTYLDTYAWVLFELGRYEEAKKIMRQVIALDTTESAEIQFHYGEILAKLGENFMAEVYYDKALKLGYDEQTINERKAKLK